MSINPITRTDYPDPDVIRVDDTYYMVSTTMHFFPGGAVLRSYDLVNWEIVNYIFDTLDDTPGEHLERESSIYGRGMWAPSLNYHEGVFYVAFKSASSGKTYLFTTDDILGKWEKHEIEGDFHDCSLLFDDDGRKYIVYGNFTIRITELKDDLSGPKEGGLSRILVEDDKSKVRLGYEGSHIYKINGHYYLFLIHWPSEGNKRRTECCFMADSLLDEFKGGEVLDDDRKYCNQGVAQGGIVDTPNGKWYSILFQDSGAVGRIPVLLPISFDKNDFPVFGVNGKIPERFNVTENRPYYRYEALYTTEFFDDNIQTGDPKHPALMKQWQWNHIPDDNLWCATGENGLMLTSGKICSNIIHSVNTLTQRMLYPVSEAAVFVDGTDMKDGDIAGLCALQSHYGYLALTKESGHYYLIKVVRNDLQGKGIGNSDFLPGEEEERIRLDGPKVRVCLKANFEKMADKLDFFYLKDGKYVKVGASHHLQFALDHFVGARFGLFMYSTKSIGGSVTFEQFNYHCGE